MPKVFFMQGDAGSGSTWYRMVLPAMGLNWLGHATAVSGNPKNLWCSADTVVGARVAGVGSVETWQRFKDAGKRLIIDLDDDYFHLSDQYHGAGRREWEDHLPRLIQNMGISDVITVASEALVEVVREYTDTPVVHIPNALPAQYIGQPKEYLPGPVKVGWAGGSGSTWSGLDSIKHALRKAHDDHQADVLIVGVNRGDPVLRGLKGTDVKLTGFLKPEDYLVACSHFDIWLAPYQDTRFNRAKFPTKVLESNFLGVPLIASAIRPYAEQIEHGKTGYLVKSDHEWRKYINLLAKNPDLRREIGLNARAQASKSILQTMNQRWQAVCLP